MIIVKLQGGLGNQMFQYAFGRSISLKMKTQLYLDVGFFEESRQGFNPVRFELDKFNICAEIADHHLIRKFKPFQSYKLNYILLKIKGYSYYRERSLEFDENVFKQPASTYFDGYWQSEKYFKDIRNILISDFEITSEFNKKFQHILLEEIQNTTSVSVHVRRGDYIHNPVVNNLFGIVTLNYYQTAISYICERVKNPIFYVFSDEIASAKSELSKLSEKVKMIFVEDQEALDPVTAHILMRNCKHHIIANSSFSWWSAWLCKNPSKIVIAPKLWFNKIKVSTSLIPENWVRL